MDILLRLIQFVALYFVIGTLFTVMIIHIYENNYNDENNFNKYLTIMSSTGKRLHLILLLIASWPYFACVFVRAICIGTIKAFKEHSNKEGDNE